MDTHSLIFSILLATEISIVAALSSNINIKNPQNRPLLQMLLFLLYLILGWIKAYFPRYKNNKRQKVDEIQKLCSSLTLQYKHITLQEIISDLAFVAITFVRKIKVRIFNSIYLFRNLKISLAVVMKTALYIDNSEKCVSCWFPHLLGDLRFYCLSCFTIGRG